MTEVINLVSLCNGIKKRILKDWDIVIAITGEEGVGKSTLAGHICKHIDKDFDWVKNVAYLPTHAEIEDKFQNLQQYQAFLVDEAIKVLYKLKWSDALQIRINEMYATERWQNKVTVMCIPRFSDFNELFRNHRIKIWIHVIDRGLAVAFIREDVNIFQNDPWRLKENAKLIDKMLKFKKVAELTSDDKINFLSRSFNFWFLTSFDNLSESDERTYKELKARMRMEKVENDPKKKEVIIQRDRLIWFLYENCYILGENNKHRRLTQMDVTKISKLSEGTVITAIKRMRKEYEETQKTLNIIDGNL